MNPPLRVVIDANVHYSANRTGNSPVHKAERAWLRGAVRLLTSPDVLEEVKRIIRKESLGLSEAEISRFFVRYNARCEMIIPPPGPPIAQCHDARDQCYLDLAHTAGADFIISGDNDLLVMAETFPVPILTPRVFAERFL